MLVPLCGFPIKTIQNQKSKVYTPHRTARSRGLASERARFGTESKPFYQAPRPQSALFLLPPPSDDSISLGPCPGITQQRGTIYDSRQGWGCIRWSSRSSRQCGGIAMLARRQYHSMLQESRISTVFRHTLCRKFGAAAAPAVWLSGMDLQFCMRQQIGYSGSSAQLMIHPPGHQLRARLGPAAFAQRNEHRKREGTASPGSRPRPGQIAF